MGEVLSLQESQNNYSTNDDQSSDNDLRTDRIVDGTFSIIFSICLIAVIWIATRNFIKFPQIVNQMNIVIVILLSLTLLSKLKVSFVYIYFCVIDRILCFLYSVFYDSNQDVDPNSLKSFIYFELPFWYLNMATVIHFFEW